MTLYDTIGKTYSRTRRPDHRITARLIQLLLLPPGSTVADIGAGTGNYSVELARAGFPCVAVEPSVEMTNQREEHQSVRWLSASAEFIPLPDRSVSACIAVLSYHHFQDRRKALLEMVRITTSGPLVFFTFCPQRLSTFWLYTYFPSMLVDACSRFPNAEAVAEEMELWSGRIATLHWFPLPADLVDCFAAAGWRRPEIYLDPLVRQGISSFANVSQRELEFGLRQLSSDLADGSWDSKVGRLRDREQLDAGYVFIHLAPD